MHQKLKIIAAGREIKSAYYWHLPAHSHKFHEIIVVLEGKLKVVLAGEKIEVGEGEVLLYRKGATHEETTVKGSPFHSIFFCFELSGLLPSIPDKTFDVDGRVRQIAYWIVENRNSSDPIVKTLDHSLLFSMINELERINSPSSGDDAMVEKTRSFMRSVLKEDVGLSDLAEHAGISKFHFVRKYGRIAGKTPMEELRLMRVNHAKELILFSGIPLKEVVVESGFKDVFQMSKTFRRLLGTSPGSYKKLGRRN